MIKFNATLLLFALAGLASGEGTRLWKQGGYEDFERGTARGVTITSTGQLELAPAFKAVYTSPSTFIWAIAAEKDGVVYAATGAPARVYRITPDGKASIIFEPKELQVQAVVLGKDGAVYAATSPDGKVYKLTRNSKQGLGAPEFSSDVFFDPKTKYIWGLTFDSQGRLYVATGDNGEIYRVDPSGHGSLFFKSDEAHIRALALDSKGNLIAGSDGSGLIYRISPAGEGFVLYSAPRKEITALAVDGQGNIYAAGTGEKHVTPPSSAPLPPPQPMPLPGAFPPGSPLVGNVNLGGSDIYIIGGDGSPRKLWSSHEDVVYALDFDSAGRLIAGTGNRGRIYAIEANGDFGELVKASASQVTALAHAPGGALYCSSSNLGKVFFLDSKLENEGSFESDVYDTKNFSRWGRAEVRGRGAFQLFARSGNVDNPDRNWSSWARIDLTKDSRLESPPARFVQWRAVLRSADPSTRLEEVAINYLPRNVAPVIDEVGVQTGARFQPPQRPTGPDAPIVNLGEMQASAPRSEPIPPAVRDRAYVSVHWSAHDDNDDNLVYSVYYRGENEREWKLLKTSLADKFLSFESSLLPDGSYVIKVVASDAPSHTPEEALTDERVSQRFDIDNTPPRIQNLSATLEGRQIHATFHAADDYSPLKRAEYSVDAGDWQYLEPVGQLSDAKVLNYDFTIVLPAVTPDEQPEPKRRRAKSSVPSPSEHVVVVRVLDRFDNMATAKSVVK